MTSSHHDHDHHEQRHAHGNLNHHGAATTTDPVCGMKVDPHGTQHRASHAGRTYYFCSAKCRQKFVAEPVRYVESPKPAADAPTGAIYTCPMHPQIRQVGPGSCPICGMALEPEQATLDEGPSHELIDMRRRFWVGAALTVPVAVLEICRHLFGLDHLVDQQTSNWIQLILATPVVLWGVAILRARLEVAGRALTQHVYADCDGHQRGVGL